MGSLPYPAFLLSIFRKPFLNISERQMNGPFKLVSVAVQ
jgi:hypothetical protein